MKTCLIPAKTFLLGEYVALTGGPAIIVTTSPSFEVGLVPRGFGQSVISPASPAGQWWSSCQFKHHDLSWFDPYQGIGGFGASSAQFIGSFLAACHLQQIPPHLELMLTAYFSMSIQSEGLRPSGYDVIAQTQQQCVFIHRQSNTLETSPWPFADIGFLLIHTGQKLATHEHLRHQPVTGDLVPLVSIVESGWRAFQNKDSALLVHAVNAYQDALTARNLMATHSLAALASLKQQFPILAAKGCGAMGADVLLLLVDGQQLNALKCNLIERGWQVMASQHNLFNNSKKMLQILSR